MAVQTQIGFFKDIVDKSQMFSRDHNLASKPVAPINNSYIESSVLKAIGGNKDSIDSSGVMHWNFHKWGDVDNVVGA